MDDHLFYRLLDRLEFSRAGYRKVRKGVKKRLARHMQELGCHDIAAYLKALSDDVEARQRCRRLLTVSSSRFFRDRQLWQDLENRIFPELAQNENREIRVWSAGCACGQEVYTIGIVWNLLRKRRLHLPALRITATDINPLYIEKARAGCYSAGSLRNVPQDLRSACFTPAKGGGWFVVRPFLRENIIWQTDDFFSGAPGNDYHLILLRNNLLTYYQGSPQKIAFIRIIDSLADNGFLVVGARESLPLTVPALVPFGSYRYVFQKRAG